MTLWFLSPAQKVLQILSLFLRFLRLAEDIHQNILSGHSSSHDPMESSTKTVLGASCNSNTGLWSM